MFANRYAVPELERLAREGRVVAFDTETTGLTPRDEICQLAAVEYVAGKEARTFMRHLRVDRPMSDAAFRTHGISPEFLAAHGVAPAEALREFLAFLGEGALLVAHNLPFDMGMFRNACSRAGSPTRSATSSPTSARRGSTATTPSTTPAPAATSSSGWWG